MKTLFSLNGRTSRLGYWRAQLLGVVIAAASWAAGLIASLAIGPVGGIAFVFLPLAIFISCAAVLRRLHDRGKNAFWWWLFCAGPFAFYALSRLVMAQETQLAALEALPFALAGFGLSLWGLVDIGFRRGQPGPNAYGGPVVAGHRAPIGSVGWWA